ncbi:unnamed protein product [Effrenium voratum]|nr:unnamed protein product [Effrenium voratum]
MNLGSTLMQRDGEDLEALTAFQSARSALEASGASGSSVAVELSALLGQAHMQRNDLAAALEELEATKAMMQNQRNLRETEAGARVLFRLGQCYLDREDLTAAVGALELAASVLTLDAEVSMTLADAYFEADEADKAVAAYDRAKVAAVAAGQQSAEALILTKRGLAYADLGDLDRALEDHESARQLAEESWTYWTHASGRMSW